MEGLTPRGAATDKAASAETAETAETVIAQLRQALSTREVIGQAKGILMAARGITSDESWALISRISQNSNVRVAHLAQALTELVAGLPHTDHRAAAVAREHLLGRRPDSPATAPPARAGTARSPQPTDELAAQRSRHSGADAGRRTPTDPDSTASTED